MDYVAEVTSAIKLLDTSINDACINSQIMASRMDRAISLKRQVELKEKAAEEAKEEAAKSGLDILAKAEALKREQQRVKETNDMHAREVNARKEVLNKEVKELQVRVSGVLNEERRSLVVSYEMHRKLKTRLTNATRERELADKEKLEKETLAHEALAFEESQMLKMVEESKRLEKEAVFYSELQECIKERESSLNSLQGGVSNIHKDIGLFIECLDQPVLSSSKTSADSYLEEQEGNTNVDITEVGHSVSTEGSVASAQTYAPQTVKPNAKKIIRKIRAKHALQRRIAVE